jgi:hypothetical protein
MAALMKQSPRIKNPSNTPSNESDLAIWENIVQSKKIG